MSAPQHPEEAIKVIDEHWTKVVEHLNAILDLNPGSAFRWAADHVVGGAADYEVVLRLAARCRILITELGDSAAVAERVKNDLKYQYGQIHAVGDTGRAGR